MKKEASVINKIFHKNGRAFGSMGYFIILMLIFLIGAPEAWLRPNLHQSVFVDSFWRGFSPYTMLP